MGNNSSCESLSENPISDILEKKIRAVEEKEKKAKYEKENRIKAGPVIDNMMEKIKNEMLNDENWYFRRGNIIFTYRMSESEINAANMPDLWKKDGERCYKKLQNMAKKHGVNFIYPKKDDCGTGFIPCHYVTFEHPKKRTIFDIPEIVLEK